MNSEIDENIKADGGEMLTSTNSATLDSLEVRKVKNDGNHEIAENTSNAVGREMSTSTNSATLDSLEVPKVIFNNDGDHDESDYQSTSCHSEDMDHQDQEVKQVGCLPLSDMKKDIVGYITVQLRVPIVVKYVNCFPPFLITVRSIHM
mgnify:CR=1 FL=1